MLKRFVSLLAAAALMIGPVSAAEEESPELVDRCASAQVSAVADSMNSPQEAIDQNPNTYWMSAYFSDQSKYIYWQADLGEDYRQWDIKEVVIDDVHRDNSALSNNGFRVELANAPDFSDAWVIYNHKITDQSTFANREAKTIDLEKATIEVDESGIHEIPVEAGKKQYRYLRVIKNIPSGESNLALAEVAVLAEPVEDTLEERCRGKNAQATQGWAGLDDPGAAIDGNPDTVWASGFFGDMTQYSCWQVDLGEDYRSYDIKRVSIDDLHRDIPTLSNVSFRVELSNSADFTDPLVVYHNKMTAPEAALPRETKVIDLEKATVEIDETGQKIELPVSPGRKQYRYLRVIKDQPGGEINLALAEVSVLAEPVEADALTERCATAIVTAGDSWDKAENAIDGNPDTAWKSAYFSDQSKYMYWQADLGEDFMEWDIKKVIIDDQDRDEPQLSNINFRVELSKTEDFADPLVVYQNKLSAYEQREARGAKEIDLEKYTVEIDETGQRIEIPVEAGQKQYRYVRMIKNVPSGETNLALAEISILAQWVPYVPEPEADPVNLAQGRQVIYAPGQTFFNGETTAASIVDGTTDSFMYANPMVSGDEYTYVLIDLGNYYPLERVAIATRSQPAGGNEFDALNLVVKASVERLPVSQMETVATLPSTLEELPLGSLWEHPLQGQVYRYIAVARQQEQLDLPMCFAELYIDTKKPIVFGSWSVTDESGAPVDAIQGGKTCTASMDVTNYGDQERAFSLVASYYGAQDLLLETDSWEITAPADATTPLQAVMPLPEDTQRVSLSVLKDFATGAMAADPLTLSAQDSQSTQEAPEGSGYVFEALDDGFSIQGRADEALSESDRLSLLVAYPDQDFQSGQGLLAADARGGQSGPAAFRMRIPADTPYGMYTVRLVKTDYLGNTTTTPFSWNRISQEEMQTVLEGFRSVTAENALQYMMQMQEEGYWDYRDICDPLPQDIGSYFVVAREGNQLGLLTDGFTTFTSIQHVRTALHQALALKNLAAEEIDLEQLEKEMQYLPKIFGSDTDPEKFSKLYETARKEEPTQAYFETMKRCAVLSQLEEASRTDVAKLLEENASLLGFDPDYVKENGLTYSDIAKYIDVQTVEQYLDGMEAEIKSAVEKAKEEKQEQGGQGGSSSGGGSRPSGGGGGSASGISGGGAIFVQSPPTEDQLQSGEKDASWTKDFQDLEQVPWAKEAILTLAEKEIINGTTPELFEPDRIVTREEFVKMVVCAFDLATTGSDELIFTDCALSDWYYPYVKAAYQNNILRGIEENLFGVGQGISRQDMAVICKRVMEIKQKSASPDLQRQFTDQDAIADYAREAVSSICAQGIMEGFPDESFRPQEQTTRAQAAVILQRLMQYFE